ncbi:MAG: hypothetical protein HYZ37_11010 [Candidatus Solibacter usitatus]|nr:hypothetical protein [Candidatus Solibacter usitatus]
MRSVLSGLTLSAAAKAAGVHPSTGFRWQRQRSFGLALKQIRAIRKELMADSLDSDSNLALLALRDCLAASNSAKPMRAAHMLDAVVNILQAGSGRKGAGRASSSSRTVAA